VRRDARYKRKKRRVVMLLHGSGRGRHRRQNDNEPLGLRIKAHSRGNARNPTEGGGDRKGTTKRPEAGRAL